jgi:hypothetical protein
LNASLWVYKRSMVALIAGLGTICMDLLRVCDNDAFNPDRTSSTSASLCSNTASMQSCRDGFVLPGSWATPSLRNKNFFIVDRFSQLLRAMTSALPAFSPRSRTDETLCCRFLNTTTVNVRQYCLLRCFSCPQRQHIAGDSGLTSNVPPLNLSAFD